jgi:predicted RNase H-like HicB family nuclease
MKSQWFKISAVVFAVVALAVLGIGVMTQQAFAQGPTPTPSGRGPIGGPRGGLHPGGLISGTMRSPVAIAAKVFGMSEADLLTALQGGKSIAEVAKEKNVALDKVVEAIIADRVAELKANLPTQLSQPFHMGHKGPGGLGAPFGNARSHIAIVAKVFGMSEADLLTALQGGKSIAEVAKEKNIALDKVVDALVADRAETLKQAVSNGRITQAQADQMLADLKTNLPNHLSQTFPQGGRSPFGHRGR